MSKGPLRFLMSALIGIVFLASLFVLTGTKASTKVSSAAESVSIVNFAFSPATITIPAGTAVVWTNQDSAPHTTTSDAGVWSSPTLTQGQSFSFTFANPGTFPYHCAIHPSMLGTVIATEAPTPEPTPTPTPIVAAPTLISPANGTILGDFNPTLTWSNPPGTTQYQLLVTPANDDGPGVNIIANAATSFTIPPPPTWYGLLPDMTYTWQVRATQATVAVDPGDLSWGPWSESLAFRTPKATSDTISLVSPKKGEMVSSLTPTLQWANSHPNVFYYEVQLSKDPTFNTDPATATAMIYWELRHGGVTSPPNSYAVPPNFPLESGIQYFWRVRPRIQGDGTPVEWGPPWSFTTPKSIAQRIEGRTFPSVIQLWYPADNVPDEDPDKTAARHDLYINGLWYYGLVWNNQFTGLGTAFTPESAARGLAKRTKLLSLNPNMVLLTSLQYRDAPATHLPEDHPWWLGDSSGNRVPGWNDGSYRLNVHDPTFRAQVVTQAKAAAESGVSDGIFLDFWYDQDIVSGRWSNQDSDPDHVALARDIRSAIGPDKLIIVNSSWFTTPNSAPYINGLFLETQIPHPADEAARWKPATETLLWAEANLRAPRINAFETWWANSRDDVNRMRATTTLALTHSNGYTLFSDPNPLLTGDHLHNWYPFWAEKGLGKPVASMVKRPDGAVQREFTGGTVVYNPIGNVGVTVTFVELRRSATTGQTGTTFMLNPMDGDLYLRQ